MFKLTRFVKSRTQFSEGFSFGTAGGIKDALRMGTQLSIAGISTANQRTTSEISSERVYADYSIFKGKAALCVSPRLPTFTKTESGSLRVSRRGVMMLTFMPAIGERKYDWEKKQIFALSATEVGTLISLSSNSSCEFFHDPSMLSSNAGQVRKTLSIKSHGDGSGFFINLSVVNNLLKTNERFSVPVTAGEFMVIKQACSFALPHIMGWDRVTNIERKAMENRPPKAGGQILDLEWDR